jgi:hypothetical protein
MNRSINRAGVRARARSIRRLVAARSRSIRARAIVLARERLELAARPRGGERSRATRKRSVFLGDVDFRRATLDAETDGETARVRNG